MDFSPYAGSNLLLQFSLPVFQPLVSGTRLPGGLEAVALATKFGQYRQGDRPRRRARRREIKLGRAMAVSRCKEVDCQWTAISRLASAHAKPGRALDAADRRTGKDTIGKGTGGDLFAAADDHTRRSFAGKLGISPEQLPERLLSTATEAGTPALKTTPFTK